MKSKKLKKRNITIEFFNDLQIYNQFNNTQISEELSEYIYNQCKGIQVNSIFTLSIKHHFKMTDEDKSKLVDSIRVKYGTDIKENLIKLRQEHLKEVIMFVIGSLLLLISNLLNSFVLPIIGEIISIFGCVVIWEIAYNIFFIETELRLKNKRLKKLTKSKIEFFEEKIDE